MMPCSLTHLPLVYSFISVGVASPHQIQNYLLKESDICKRCWWIFFKDINVIRVEEINRGRLKLYFLCRHSTREVPVSNQPVGNNNNLAFGDLSVWVWV